MTWLSVFVVVCARLDTRFACGRMEPCSISAPTVVRPRACQFRATAGCPHTLPGPGPPRKQVWAGLRDCWCWTLMLDLKGTLPK
ncbi:hypothetical protein V8C86DRAFT_2800108 [Haematococcus lacustris]